MLDTLLVIAHHLLIFGLLGMLVAEMVMVRDGIATPTVKALIRIDGIYGAVAGLTIIVGVCRVIWGLKGADYYLHNLFFWLKMASFILVGICTVPPTLAFLRWRKALTADSTFLPTSDEIAKIRRWLRAQLHLFVLIPIFAALMARYSGYIAF
jgi:putative membrane protein